MAPHYINNQPLSDRQSGDVWYSNMAGFHKRRSTRNEEHFNLPITEILNIMKQRGKCEVDQEESEPRLMKTPDGLKQALYVGARSKWCPEGSEWTLEQAE